jgi:hypothetical protein
MAGPTGRCVATSNNTSSFTVFVNINFGYKVTIQKDITIFRCGEDKSPPTPQPIKYNMAAGSFSGTIHMSMNAAGTAFEPNQADINRYNQEYDAKVQELNDAVAAENMITKTLENKTVNVECEPRVPPGPGGCPPAKPAVMGTATRIITENTNKTLFVAHASVRTSGGAMCTFN